MNNVRGDHKVLSVDIYIYILEHLFCYEPRGTDELMTAKQTCGSTRSPQQKETNSSMR